MIYYLKRFGAYIIDLIILTTITSLIISIPYFSNINEKYNSNITDYEKELKNYYEYIEDINEYYNNQHEDNLKIIKSNELYYIIEDEELKNLNEEEYNEIISKIYDKVIKNTEKYNYNLLKIKMPISVVTLLVSLLYFMLVPLFKEKTIGMIILKLQYNSKESINFINLFLRTLPQIGAISFLMNSCLLYNFNYEDYTNFYIYISIIKILFNITNIIMIIVTKKHKAIYDMISGITVEEITN